MKHATSKFNTQADLHTIPFVGCYLFYNNDGSERQTGYVAFEDNKAVWAKTKRDAVHNFKYRI